MNIYNILKWYRRIQNPRLKLLGILLLHITKRRYLSIAMDPSLACNLRCRMCYFSNPDSTRWLHGVFSEEDIQQIAKAVFHRGLRLQIGCGAEPTTYKGLSMLVKTAHDYGIPHISITTNGNLLTQERLQELADNGLHEIVISTHGMDRETYEHMMRNAKFDLFTQLINNIGGVKELHPALKLRINFTMCAENIESLKNFYNVFNNVKPDILQLRPVQDIGSNSYENYSMEELKNRYDEIINPLVEYCQKNGITCLYPEKNNIDIVEDENKRKRHINTTIEMLPNFHLSPHSEWKKEFNPYEETFEQYSKRTHHVRFIWKHLLNPYREDKQESMTKAFNYTIK